MRFIDLSKLPIPSEWTAEEMRLVDELAAMTPEERSEAFKKSKYRVWALWARLLRGLSYDKCWYSEFRITGASPDVDHYRPKNSISKIDAPAGHGGYWWLGVLVSNFRFSCQDCNRLKEDDRTGEVLGKGARFPLQAGGIRATVKDALLGPELPLLLDPTVKTDVELLWFDEDGTVACRNSDENSIDYKRVMASRDCYHLDELAILTRRGEVCGEVKRIAESLEEHEADAAAGDAKARRQLIEKKIRLLEMTREYAEFSAAARATLKGYDYIASAQEILAK